MEIIPNDRYLTVDSETGKVLSNDEVMKLKLGLLQGSIMTNEQAVSEDLKRQEQHEEIQRRRKNSPFSKFIQLNRDTIKTITQANVKNPTAISVFLFLLDNMDRYNAIIVSYRTMQEFLGYSRPTLVKSIKYLKDNGFIYVYNSGGANIYVINNDVVWSTYGDEVKYCKFPANVMLSQTENKDSLDKIKTPMITTKKKEK